MLMAIVPPSYIDPEGSVTHFRLLEDGYDAFEGVYKVVHLCSRVIDVRGCSRGCIYAQSVMKRLAAMVSRPHRNACAGMCIC